MTEEMGLEAIAKNSQWRRRLDVLQGQSVLRSGNGDRKSLVIKVH